MRVKSTQSRIAVVSSLALIVLGGCGLGPKASCERAAESVCAKAFACADAATRAERFGAAFGTTEAECVSKNRESCASIDEAKACPGGFDGVGAAKAEEDFRALSCEAWSSKDEQTQRYIGDFCAE